VLPELKGRLDGAAIRVPVPDGSVVDLVVRLNRETTAEEVNAAMNAAALGPLQRVLQYSEEPLVSSDIIGNPHSSIFDAPSTLMVGPKELRCLAWYDKRVGLLAARRRPRGTARPVPRVRPGAAPPAPPCDIVPDRAGLRARRLLSARTAPGIPCAKPCSRC